MPRYKAVSEVTGLDLTKPALYRETLDTARSLAQRYTCIVRVVDADTGAAYMIVHPEGRTESPNKHHKRS